ncbi:DUF6503 family protein [Flavobacteriaceae bacterium]|nr:DUF6503 family protein [Flavobacteriaceae bacterium]MDB4172341.1 DUF6503 family protein [Flavobacteriaceae bacterium]MDC1472898.1 DUF6503 family protein [Flavobacteriaceae bacterium]
MRSSISFLCLFFFVGLSRVNAQESSNNSIAAAPLLEKSIAYHDPQNLWPRFKAAMRIEMKTPNKPLRSTQIHMDHTKGRFELNATRGDEHTQYILGPNQCDISFNDRREFTPEEIKTHRLDCAQAQRMKNYYTYLYGLPMKLKDPGTQLDPMAYKKTFQGAEYWMLKVSYAPEVGKDVWYFYLDPKTYQLRHYQFYHDEQKGDGEFILLDGETVIGGIKMPKDRAWYTNLENNYLGTDFLSALEE